MATKKNARSPKSTKDSGNLPIYAIARAIDMSSRELRDTIASWPGIDWDVSNHMKKLDVAAQREIEQRLGVSFVDDASQANAPTKRAKGPAADKPAPKTNAKPKKAAKRDEAKAEAPTEAKTDAPAEAKTDAPAEAKPEAKRAPKASAKPKKTAKRDEAKAEAPQEDAEAPQEDAKPAKKSRARKPAKEAQRDEAPKSDALPASNDPDKDYVAIGSEWLVGALQRLGFAHPRVSGEIDARTIRFNITGAKSEELLRSKNAAARTDVIVSMQQVLARVLFAGDHRDSQAVVIDVQDFRAKRAEGLRHAADTAAAYVRASGHKLRFAAMNTFDRRAMHEALREEEGMRTESSGYGVRRRLELSKRKPRKPAPRRDERPQDDAKKSDEASADADAPETTEASAEA